MFFYLIRSTVTNKFLYLLHRPCLIIGTKSQQFTPCITHRLRMWMRLITATLIVNPYNLARTSGKAHRRMVAAVLGIECKNDGKNIRNPEINYLSGHFF
jgi:hypothetical protein